MLKRSRRTTALTLMALLIMVTPFVYAGCKADCADEYDSAKEDCVSQYDDPEDAGDLQTCLQDAASDYEDCIYKCNT